MSLYDQSMWGSTNESVSILVPTRETLHSHFTFSLANLVKLSTQMGLEVNLFFDSSTILINQRENLVKQAIKAKTKWILWLDSDMMFPETTLLRLLKHQENIVGCNYMKRAYPFKSVTYRDITDWESWIPIKYQDELEEAEASGLGCMLMKTAVFSTLQEPYFEYTYKADTKDWLGEDFTLFKKLSKKGLQLKIDMNLSNEIYHIGTFAYGRSLSANVNKIKENNIK